MPIYAAVILLLLGAGVIVFFCISKKISRKAKIIGLSVSGVLVLTMLLYLLLAGIFLYALSGR